MSINTVYYRDKTGVYGTLNTDDYVFNDLVGSGSASFEPNIYPYIKIKETYYLNDGEI